MKIELFMFDFHGSGLFLVRQLRPWHANLKKRQVKAPKVYVRDSGLLHSLLGLGSEQEVLSHPKVGSSWEGFAIETVLDVVRPDAAYFWATHSPAHGTPMIQPREILAFRPSPESADAAIVVVGRSPHGEAEMGHPPEGPGGAAVANLPS